MGTKTSLRIDCKRRQCRYQADFNQLFTSYFCSYPFDDARSSLSSERSVLPTGADAIGPGMHRRPPKLGSKSERSIAWDLIVRPSDVFVCSPACDRMHTDSCDWILKWRQSKPVPFESLNLEWAVSSAG